MDKYKMPQVTGRMPWMGMSWDVSAMMSEMKVHEKNEEEPLQPKDGGPLGLLNVTPSLMQKIAGYCNYDDICSLRKTNHSIRQVFLAKPPKFEFKKITIFMDHTEEQVGMSLEFCETDWRTNPFPEIQDIVVYYRRRNGRTEVIRHVMHSYYVHHYMDNCDYLDLFHNDLNIVMAHVKGPINCLELRAQRDHTFEFGLWYNRIIERLPQFPAIEAHITFNNVFQAISMTLLLEPWNLQTLSYNTDDNNCDLRALLATDQWKYSNCRDVKLEKCDWKVNHVLHFDSVDVERITFQQVLEIVNEMLKKVRLDHKFIVQSWKPISKTPFTDKWGENAVYAVANGEYIFIQTSNLNLISSLEFRGIRRDTRIKLIRFIVISRSDLPHGAMVVSV